LAAENGKQMSKRRTYKLKALIQLFTLIVAIVIANLLSVQFFTKIDLTKEKRYTLSPVSKSLAAQVDDVIFFKVYLDGNLSPKFKKLRTAVLDMLSELRELSSQNIEYEFIDAFTGKSNQEKDQILGQLSEKGLIPYDDIQDENLESQSRNLIIPGAEVVYKSGQSFPVHFFGREFGNANEVTINQAIENLEYEFSNAIRKAISEKKKRIAFLQGHGELNRGHIYDLQSELSDYYRVDEVNLDMRDPENIVLYKEAIESNIDSAGHIILNSLQKRINAHDGLVIAKPTEDLTREEAFLIDQFVMKGGKVIWLINALQADMDSLRNKDRMVCVDYNLENIRDMLFQYGVRLNPDLLLDIQCNMIPLADPYSRGATKLYPWVYYPLFSKQPSVKKHPITNNLGPVWGRFPGTLKILNRDEFKATPLLVSSMRSKIVNSPALVDFSSVQYLRDQDPGYLSTFKDGNQVVAVLLEGKFKSAFTRRNINLEVKHLTETQNQMIVIADGDMAKNFVGTSGEVLPLGWDNKTQRTFSNRKFMLNCIDFLLDDSGLMEIRNKEIILRLLNKEKAREEKVFWQIFNLGIPVGIMILFGFVNGFIRRRKYAK
jgi:ABC-2 type transport system permease protein